MEYPTATARQGYRGPSRQLPIPANQNRPKAPVLPFNAPYRQIEKQVGKKAARAFAGIAAKSLLRFVPLINTALFVWDLYELWMMFQAKQDVPFSFSGAGWVRDSSCNTYGGGAAVGHMGWTCINGLAVEFPTTFASRDGNPYWYQSGQWRASFRKADTETLSTGNIRFAIGDAYHYNTTNPVMPPATVVYPHVVPPKVVPNPLVRPDPYYDPALPPTPGMPVMPSAPPTIDPFGWPLNAPAPMPRALPWRLLPYLRPNPWRSPSEQTIRGSGMPNKPPRDLPVEFPTIIINPDGSISPGPVPKAKRVKPKEKERKMKMSAGARFVLGVVNESTEAVDALDAFYKALPRERKKRYKDTKLIARNVSVHEKADLVYRHFDEVNLPEALKNLVANQIEDAIYGGIGNALKKASKRAKPHGDIPIGFGTGPLM